MICELLISLRLITEGGKKGAYLSKFVPQNSV